MKQVAVISQTLRALHCYAYMRDSLNEQVILTTDPSAFADLHFPSSTRIVPTTPPRELLPGSRLFRTRVQRRMLSWARSGSALGRWLEHATKGLVAWLRRHSSSVPYRDSHNDTMLPNTALESSDLYLRLVKEHQMEQIERVIVFDLFDLPVVLLFSEKYQVDVVVR